jgi:hypothetical protein
VGRRNDWISYVGEKITGSMQSEPAALQGLKGEMKVLK